MPAIKKYRLRITSHTNAGGVLWECRDLDNNALVARAQHPCDSTVKTVGDIEYHSANGRYTIFHPEIPSVLFSGTCIPMSVNKDMRGVGYFDFGELFFAKSNNVFLDNNGVWNIEGRKYECRVKISEGKKYFCFYEKRNNGSESKIAQALFMGAGEYYGYDYKIVISNIEHFNAVMMYLITKSYMAAVIK